MLYGILASRSGRSNHRGATLSLVYICTECLYMRECAHDLGGASQVGPKLKRPQHS